VHEDLTEFHARAAREGKPYGVAMCDLDCFQRYNDAHGNLEGDEVLRRVAAAIVSHSRAKDRPYRYGDEEFIILLHDTLTGAELAAERCRRAVEDLGIDHAGNEPWGLVTISVGVAVWDGARPTDGFAVVAQADRALDEAKHGGRNRVVGPLSGAPLPDSPAAGRVDSSPAAPRA
jgi:two-component system chemotaxis family response regulator WspR